MARKRKRGPNLGELIDGRKQVLRVLDAHGITFCAGCYLTLFAAPEKAAVYHAVPDVDRFLADLRKALGRRQKRTR